MLIYSFRIDLCLIGTFIYYNAYNYLDYYNCETMNTELDKVKSTITISLGLKNRLRDVKGSSSYEKYIAQLLRTKNEVNKDNYIELQKFQRKEKVYSINDLKIVFSYNKYNKSSNFIFDIQIGNIRQDGQNILSISAKQTAFAGAQGKQDFPLRFGNDELQSGYRVYFELLVLTIQSEIEPMFKHNGRFEDYYSWQKEFDLLGISKKAFENDVMEKLNDFKNGVHYK
jgi:hypothetical protein